MIPLAVEGSNVSTGGILVREGQALTSKARVKHLNLVCLGLDEFGFEQASLIVRSSEACDDRLSTGASVKELQLVGDRLCCLEKFSCSWSA